MILSICVWLIIKVYEAWWTHIQNSSLLYNYSYLYNTYLHYTFMGSIALYEIYLRTISQVIFPPWSRYIPNCSISDAAIVRQNTNVIYRVNTSVKRVRCIIRYINRKRETMYHKYLILAASFEKFTMKMLA